MNNLMRASLISFAEKVECWEPSSFNNPVDYNFVDFVEEVRLEDQKHHYWETPEKLYTKYFCGIIIPTKFLYEMINTFYHMKAFYVSNNTGYSIFMFSILDEEELNKIAKTIYNLIKRDKIKHMLLCSAGDILDEL